MKRYSVRYSSGHICESSNPNEAVNWHNQEDGQRYMIKGVDVSPEVFFADVVKVREAAFNKKNATHKQVRVLHGSSATCYVTKWVAR